MNFEDIDIEVARAKRAIFLLLFMLIHLKKPPGVPWDHFRVIFTQNIGDIKVESARRDKQGVFITGTENARIAPQMLHFEAFIQLFNVIHPGIISF